MNLTLIAALISAGVAGLAGFGAAWTIQGRTIDKLIIEAKDERIAQYRQSRANTERLTSQIAQAQESASNRAAVLALDADRARGESNGLRDSIATAMRASASTLEACTRHAGTLGELLGSCGDRLKDVSADADKWANQAVTLQKAWPK
jgi:hypothetical protein